MDQGTTGNGLREALGWLSNHVQADVEVVRAAKATMTHYDNKVGSTEVFEKERRLFAPLWGGPANQSALNSHIKHLK